MPCHLQYLLELTRYLHRTKATWDIIVCDIGACVDVDTVKSLQGLYPFRSIEDRLQVEERINASIILLEIISQPQRTQLLARISSIPYIIPSLHTFLEDTKYLEPCCKILREILPPSSKGTIFQRFRRIHNRQLHIKIQLTELTSEERLEQTSTIAQWKGLSTALALYLSQFPINDGSHTSKRSWQAETVPRMESTGTVVRACPIGIRLRL